MSIHTLKTAIRAAVASQTRVSEIGKMNNERMKPNAEKAKGYRQQLETELHKLYAGFIPENPVHGDKIDTRQRVADIVAAVLDEMYRGTKSDSPRRTGLRKALGRGICLDDHKLVVKFPKKWVLDDGTEQDVTCKFEVQEDTSELDRFKKKLPTYGDSDLHDMLNALQNEIRDRTDRELRKQEITDYIAQEKASQQARLAEKKAA